MIRRQENNQKLNDLQFPGDEQEIPTINITYFWTTKVEILNY